MFVKAILPAVALIASVSAQCGINSAATNLIQGYEKFRARPYDDGSGFWTVGYGHRVCRHVQVCEQDDWKLIVAP